MKYPSYVTTLSGGKTAQLNFNVSGEGSEAPEQLSVTMELVYSPTEKEPSKYEIVSFGLYDLTTELR